MVNWSLSTRPRQLGGLGIRDVQITNHALLMRWTWQWLDQKQAWWKTTTPLPSPSDKPWQTIEATPFWKKISTIAPAFEAFVFHRVGDGQSTNFWHDSWHGKPLKHLFPALYQAAQQKYISVADCKQGAEWVLHFSPLTSIAQQEQGQMMLLLQQFPPAQQQDEIVWLRHPATFTVSSVYKFLSHTPSPDSNIKNIWKIQAPLRISIFAWLLLNNHLTTVDNLARRGLQLPNMCMMCKVDQETVPHLFQNCVLAKQLRSYLIAAFAHHFPIPPKFSDPQSTLLMTDPSEEMKDRQWELVTCFVLWRE